MFASRADTDSNSKWSKAGLVLSKLIFILSNNIAIAGYYLFHAGSLFLFYSGSATWFTPVLSYWFILNSLWYSIESYHTMPTASDRLFESNTSDSFDYSDDDKPAPQPWYQTHWSNFKNFAGLIPGLLVLVSLLDRLINPKPLLFPIIFNPQNLLVAGLSLLALQYLNKSFVQTRNLLNSQYESKTRVANAREKALRAIENQSVSTLALKTICFAMVTIAIAGLLINANAVLLTALLNSSASAFFASHQISITTQILLSSIAYGSSAYAFVQQMVTDPLRVSISNLLVPALTKSRHRAVGGVIYFCSIAASTFLGISTLLPLPLIARCVLGYLTATWAFNHLLLEREMPRQKWKEELAPFMLETITASVIPTTVVSNVATSGWTYFFGTALSLFYCIAPRAAKINHPISLPGDPHKVGIPEFIINT